MTRRSPGEGLGLVAASRTLYETHAGCPLLEGGVGVKMVQQNVLSSPCWRWGLAFAVAVRDIEGRIPLHP